MNTPKSEDLQNTVKYLDKLNCSTRLTRNTTYIHDITMFDKKQVCTANPMFHHVSSSFSPLKLPLLGISVYPFFLELILSKAIRQRDPWWPECTKAQNHNGRKWRPPFWVDTHLQPSQFKSPPFAPFQPRLAPGISRVCSRSTCIPLRVPSTPAMWHDCWSHSMTYHIKTHIIYTYINYI